MCISRQINQTLEVLPRAYEEMKWKDLDMVAGLKAKIPTEVNGDFTSDRKSYELFIIIFYAPNRHHMK